MRLRIGQQSIVSFKGLDTDSSPSERDPGLLQADEGSSHQHPGVWQLRRGREHANVTKKSASIVGLVGVELDGGDYVAVVADSTNLYSEASFDE